MQSCRGALGRLGVVGFAAVLLMTLAPAHSQTQTQAQVQWKWKDSSGQVHVSDLPPPREIADKDVLERPNLSVRRPVPVPARAASAPASAAGARARVDPELESRRTKAEQERLAKAKVEDDKLSAQRSENCQRARAHLGALEGGQRIARLNSQGEREVLDDKGRAEEMQRARQVIAADCR